MSDALELMKAAHKRSYEAMQASKPCTDSAHSAVVDGIVNSHSDSEIIYVALSQSEDRILQRINDLVDAAKDDDLPPPPVPTVTASGKPYTKLRWKGLEISTTQLEVGKAIGALVSAFVLLVLLVVVPVLVKNLRHDLTQRISTVEQHVAGDTEP